jgi:hypothetical protein
MLVAMDSSPAGPGIAPWLVLGIAVAVVLAVVGAVLLLRRRAARRVPRGGDTGLPRGYEEDDLPGFLQSPPGTAGRPDPPADGWPPLAGSAAASRAPAPAPAVLNRSHAVLAAVLALTALLVAALLVVALLVAVQSSPGRHGTPERDGGGAPAPGAADLPAPPSAPAPGDAGAGELADTTVRPGRDGGAARLEFGGLVLEQRAVGVTVTYPLLEATWNGRQGVAHLRLPTFNCLAASAPDDPVAAGCTPTVPEWADLPSPALDVSRDDGTVQLSGRFATYVRPNGSPPVWTGRVYEILVRAAPAAGEPQEGRVRAEGEIRLGSGAAPALAGSRVTVPRRD